MSGTQVDDPVHAPSKAGLRHWLSTANNPLLPSGVRGTLLVLVLVVLVPVLVVQAGLHYLRYQQQRAQEFQSNLELAGAVGAIFEEYVQDVLHQELAIGLALSSTPAPSLAGMNELLRVNADDYPSVRDYAWVAPDGRVVAASTSEAIGLDVADRPYFRKSAAGPA